MFYLDILCIDSANVIVTMVNWSILIKVCLLYFEVSANQEHDKIQGPKSFDDKIAIVGAGPSGVHMAYLLKKKGFKNLHILERSSRIGGKSHTVYHRNMPIEMGTTVAFGNDVIEFIKQFVPVDPVEGSEAYWTDSSPYPIKKNDYDNLFRRKVLGQAYVHANASELIAKRDEAINAFLRLREKIFGSKLVPPKPSEENLMLAAGSIKDFLVRNNLTILMPEIVLSIVANCYGYLEEIPAIYLMIQWDPLNKQGIVASGFQNFWETVVRRESLQVTFNVDILSVDRNLEHGNRAVWLYKKVKGNDKPRWERYDFLIWSPEMKVSMDRWENYIPIERELFNGAVPISVTTSIVDTHNFFSEYEGNEWLDNMLKSKRQNVVTMVFRSDKTKRPITTYTSYQSSLYRAPMNYLELMLVNHFRHFGAKSFKILKMIRWRYFPKYSSSQLLDGVLWKILDIQGKYGMWYIGSSVWFESITGVTRYNNHLVENMVMPSE